MMSEFEEFLKHPDPKLIAEGIKERAKQALKNLAEAHRTSDEKVGYPSMARWRRDYVR